MRRFICALVWTGLLTGLLAGCGDDDGDQAREPDAAAPEPGLVQTIVLTSAGGKVDPTAYLVDDRDQMRAYLRTFTDRDRAAAAIQQAVDEAGERAGRLAVATVAIGCDVPEDVTITEDGDSVLVTAGKIANPQQECFAPTTSIALVQIP